MSDKYDLNQGWASNDTAKSRRLYLIGLVNHFSQGKIVKSKLKPAGFDDERSDLFWPYHFDDDRIKLIKKFHAEVHDKIRKLPDNIVFKSNRWQMLEKYINQLSREFKIHLQPQEDKIPLVVARLTELLSSDQFFLDNILGFKLPALFPAKYLSENRAAIVVYLDYKENRKQARSICQQALAKLKTGLADCEKDAESRLPVYNFPVTDLISFIQVGTDLKFYLENILGQHRFDILFPREYYQALLMDEDPTFYVPDTNRTKLILPIPPKYQLPDITKFPLMALKFDGLIENSPQTESCCPRCGKSHSFSCEPAFWTFDCDNCQKYIAICQTVPTTDGPIQVFVCPGCKSAYRIYRNDEERFAMPHFD